MDYTKKIFKMLGVEPEEEFKTRHRIYNSDQQLYKIDRKLNVFGFYNAEWIELDETHLLQMLLNGDAKIIKIPHPTAEEQVAFDYARACGMKWIAKDKDKKIVAFKEKPSKGRSMWLNITGHRNDWMTIRIPISFLSWEDEEPYYIWQDGMEEKEVCKYYSGGECMGQKYHPSVECKGDKSCCEGDS